MRDSVLALVLFVPLVGGCGTIANLSGLSERDDRGKMGGGYRLDMIAFQNAISAPDLIIDTGEPRAPHPRGPFEWLGVFAPLDLPFSIVGDILTLPYTIPSDIWYGLKHMDAPPSRMTARDLEWERIWHTDEPVAKPVSP